MTSHFKTQQITKEMVVQLRQQGLTLEEIAKKLGCSVNLVYTRLKK